MSNFPQQAAQKIKELAPNIQPKLGIVVGSGLGFLADKLTDAVTIPYSDLPGFPDVNVAGHVCEMVLGYLNGTPVACLKGRAHTYEGTSYEAVRNYVRTLKLIGCEFFLATNASGSLNENVGPGSLMMIGDHINMQFGNPLVGPNADEFGPRFPPMDNAYDPELRQKLAASAEKLGIDLAEGVYISVLGPSYETPAEIRAFRAMGADAVGMSTVPEVIVARHCGLKVAVIATITNFACGLSKTSLNHDDVLETTAKASDKLMNLVTDFAGSL